MVVGNVRRAPTRARQWCALLAGTVLPVALGAGCQSMSNTDKGVLAGGGLGAAVGALAGGPRHAGAGALIGGAAGAVAGGLTGAAIDNSEHKAEARAAAAAAAARPPLSLEEVVRLTAGGSSDTIIINQIRLSGSVYYLSAGDIEYLHNHGVREPVISEMQATAARVPRPVYAPVPQPVYVYPAPPPPVGVGVGFSYVGGRRW
jgi:hypothetical protein